MVKNIPLSDTCLTNYPTLAREFQGFRVWGKFVFWTLELTDTPTNLANQVKVGHALDQSRSFQSRGPERAHLNNEPSWRSSRADVLGQLNLEPTRPNGLVGCKVPTDLVKISVKEATHMGFHYIHSWVTVLVSVTCTQLWCSFPDTCLTTCTSLKGHTNDPWMNDFGRCLKEVHYTLRIFPPAIDIIPTCWL